MGDDEIALRQNMLEFDTLAGKLARRFLEVIDKRLDPVGNAGVMLNIFSANIFLCRFARTTLIEKQIVEIDDRLFISLKKIRHCKSRCSR
jgi:hypothetical protein